MEPERFKAVKRTIGTIVNNFVSVQYRFVQLPYSRTLRLKPKITTRFLTTETINEKGEMVMNKNLVRGAIVTRFGSQCVAARVLGIHERRLSRLLNGHDQPKPEEVKIFQKQLGVKIEGTSITERPSA
jgi:hypothetical protein